MKIKHCKNCGRYFVLKGNYKTDFCDRILEGESRSCQSIGAIGNYQKKVAGNPALKLFNKYYKRYFARVNVGTIKETAFKEWKYQAVVKRDECMLGESNGGISEQEFADWLEASFPNRVKKNQNRL